MPEANGMILSKEEENDAEVRREDQDAINEFGRLNARLDEVKRQIESMKVRIIALLLSYSFKKYKQTTHKNTSHKTQITTRQKQT